MLAKEITKEVIERIAGGELFQDNGQFTPSVGDFDDINVRPGVYRVATSHWSTIYPTYPIGQGLLFIVRSGSVCVQIIYSINTNIHIRVHWDKTWGPWKRITATLL